MTEYVMVHGKVQRSLLIPDGFERVASDTRKRNGEQVLVERYQHGPEVVPNNAHVTLVYGDDGRLISYNNSMGNPELPLPATGSLEEQALTVWQTLDAKYAAGLHFMRIDPQTRSYLDNKGNSISYQVFWVKFAHDNGSYNWVTYGPGEQVLEFERESEWDYFRSRRKTESWNSDDWVLVREGKAPQLPAPFARA